MFLSIYHVFLEQKMYVMQAFIKVHKLLDFDS